MLVSWSPNLRVQRTHATVPRAYVLTYLTHVLPYHTHSLTHSRPLCQVVPILLIGSCMGRIIGLLLIDACELAHKNGAWGTGVPRAYTFTCCKRTNTCTHTSIRIYREISPHTHTRTHTHHSLTGQPCNYNGDGEGFDFSWMDPGAMAVKQTSGLCFQVGPRVLIGSACQCTILIGWIKTVMFDWLILIGSQK